MCDLDNDCGDNSDELNCSPTKCNAEQQFACSDQVCISKKWVCDGAIDCQDGADEKVFDGELVNCSVWDYFSSYYIALIPTEC